jgi:hypothetical protein
VSQWLVTINPGRAYTDKASLKAAKDALTEKVDMIFGNLEEYLEVFKPAGNDFVRMNLTREQLDRLIVKGDVESHVEIGSKMHLSIHMDMKIRCGLSIETECL